MEYVPLGRTGRLVSRIGFGCAAIGGYDYGPADDAESTRAVQAALDRGITVFDTADVYGFGHAEEVLGAALGAKRHDVVIATKFGVTHDGTRAMRDSSARRVRPALEASLRRLRVDRVTVYQVHWWDGTTPIEQTLEEMECCRAEGLIEHIGICNAPPKTLDRCWGATRIETLQYPFSVLERDVRTVLSDATHKFGVTVLVYNALAHGLLTGKYASGSQFSGTDLRARYPLFSGDMFQRALRHLDVVRGVAQRVGTSPARVAIRWVLEALPTSVVLTGIRTAAQVEENAGATGWALDAEATAALDSAALDSGSAGRIND